jgi:hypothetical protein
LILAIQRTFASPQSNYRIGVGDVDGDGKPDLVTKSSGENVFSVYRNSTTQVGDVTFDTRIDYFDSFNYGEVSGIVIGDLDGDYVPDIALSGISSNAIRIYRNQSVQSDSELPTARAKNIIIGLGTDGTATVTADMVDNGSSDACGIDRIVLSKTNFTCQNIGENVVTLSVYDRQGNVSTTTAIVNIQSAAIISIGQTTVCAGQTVSLSANPGSAYQWYRDNVLINGATTQNLTATQSGDYTVSVTNVGGCSGLSLPTTVFINAAPSINVLPNGNTYLCGSWIC